ncbi:trefoil factor 1 [Notamacropus eugenii]|uniref:trefoil factor 1 n=1 Tax=Notamacropus eugenii TaxID=9315 RepID=UPI003B66B829
MEYKVICTLMITLMLGLSVLSQEASETCIVDPKQRRNCGWSGITQQQCQQNKCCFDNKISGTPWCFYPEPIEDDCNF